MALMKSRKLIVWGIILFTSWQANDVFAEENEDIAAMTSDEVKPLNHQAASKKMQLLSLDDDPEYIKARRMRRGGIATLAAGLPVGSLLLIIGLGYSFACGLGASLYFPSEHMSYEDRVKEEETNNRHTSECESQAAILSATGGIIAFGSLVTGVTLIHFGKSRMKEIRGASDERLNPHD